MLDHVNQIEPRPAHSVMRLARMGQSMPHKLSFSRQIIRRMLSDGSAVDRCVWNMNTDGHGRAVYTVHIGGYPYSLVAISNALDDSMRSDRVIAEAWDACFTLFDGIPTADDLDRLANNQPKQEAGRYSARELTLSRANKSMRLFGYVRDCLAQGEQPDASSVNGTGYLMRTTAVYGNGKFGIADRHDYADRPGMSGPFQAEMLTVWLIREFTHDLVEHCAKALNPNAVSLAPRLKQHFGVGNSTGLGMAPFLVHHPELLDRWVMARECALAMVLMANESLNHELIERVDRHLAQWNVDDTQAQAAIETSRAEWRSIPQRDVQSTYEWSQSQSLGTQELVTSLILENTGMDLEPFAQAMAFDGPPALDLNSPIEALKERIDQAYSWALTDDSDEYWFWYVSENKLEPRIGARNEQDGAELERPLTVVRNIKQLRTAIDQETGTCGEFLTRHPSFVATLRRLGASGTYGEIQDNLLAKSMRPIDMLRFKLSFFGASKFDPKSDLWTRITLFQGAPTRHTLHETGDNWWLSTI